jgi:hypothetical protein
LLDVHSGRVLWVEREMKKEGVCLAVLGSEWAELWDWYHGCIDSDSGGSFLKEWCKRRSGMAMALQAIKEQVGEVFHVRTILVLPDVSVQGPEYQSIEDASWRLHQ